MGYIWIGTFALLSSMLITSVAAENPFLELGVCPTGFGENASVCDGGAICEFIETTNNISSPALSILCFDMGLLRGVRCNVTQEEFCQRHILCTAGHEVNKCDMNCSSHYRCRDGGDCVARSTLCNGQECTGCRYAPAGPGFKCVRNGWRCNIPSALVRDGIKDCDEGEDERDSDYYFTCQDNSLISKNSVCDGVRDCNDLSDECFCQEADPHLCRFLNTQKDEQPQRDGLEFCPIQEPCTQYDLSQEPVEILDRTTDKPTLCKMSRKSNYTTVSRCEVCNYRIACIDGEDEMNCTDGRHYCKSGSPSYVRPHQINDGRMDCSDGSDECLKENGPNTFLFHSRYAQIGNTFLFVLVWLILIFALAGNSIVLVQETRTLCEMRHKLEVLSSLRANHVLVLNLTVANLLMVFYLVCLGISYEQLRGIYCQEEFRWRSSNLCMWMGVMVTVSIETSVQTLLLLTVVRFNSVLKPYKVTSQPHMKLLIPLIALIWTISIVVAWLPLSQTYRKSFPDNVWIAGNPFLDNADANITTAKNFLYRYSAYLMRNNNTRREIVDGQISSAQDWGAIKSINAQLNGKDENLKISARFTYYGTHSVCIPNMFPTNNNPHRILSLTVLNFNFVSFVLIAILYLIICVRTKTNSAQGRFKTDAVTMQWKVFRLTASNFCCWIPIYVMAYVALSGSNVHGDAYVVSAIVLLPMNSAISPFLYSSAIPRTFNYAFGWYKHFNSSPRRKSVEMSEL